jgi:hypothetical protein
MRLVTFVPFTDKDFDAYLEPKWQSNVFNRERLEIKQKLMVLGKLLSPMMVASNGSLLDYEASTEHPAVWNQHRVKNQYLFFSRSAEARRELDTIISKKRSISALIEDPSPLSNHIFLSVMIDRNQIELALKLHSDAVLDRENMQRRFQEFFQRDRLISSISLLPDYFLVGIDGQEGILAQHIDQEKLQGFILALPEANSWLSIRHSIGRKEEILRQESFVDAAKQDLSLLLPVLHLIAWNRENDFVSMKETLKKREVEQAAKGLTKHAPVRIVKGIFQGKNGIIQEIDTKGIIKVLVGTVVVKLQSADVQLIERGE